MKSNILTFILLISLVVSCFDNTKKTHTSELKKNSSYVPVVVDSTITIIAVGDIMLGTNYPNNSLLPKDFDKLFEFVREDLSDAHIRFCNLEGCISDSGGVPKSCSDPSICYLFRQPSKIVKSLIHADFNLISVANNHIFDFGDETATRTIDYLTENGIRTAGIIEKPWDTITVNKKLIGFTAFATNIGTMDMLDHSLLQKTVNELKNICDIVVVSFHGGAEGNNYKNVTREYEFFLDDNRGNVYEFAHRAIDYGADLVLGHGPHVPRAIEIYNNKLIAYSLGNFCTYRKFNLSGANGYAPMLKVEIDQSGNFVKGEIKSYIQKGSGGPKPDKFENALKEIIRLTNEDFPNSKIIFFGNTFKLSN